MPELSRMKAVFQICDDNDLDSTSLRHAPLSMIETLQEAAYQQMQAEASQMTASAQLPEAQERALDEYPMPDEQVSTPDMQEYGYTYDGMIPVMVAELEQQARSGQPISLMELAAATHREEWEKKKSVVDQLKSQPKAEHKKTALKKSAEREI